MQLRSTRFARPVRTATLLFLLFALLGAVPGASAEDGGPRLLGAARPVPTPDTSVPAALKTDGAWTSAGPTSSTSQFLGEAENIPNRPWIGAINAVAAHPTNADILYVGSANGGIWRTNNATAASPTWVPQTDNLPSLSIGAIAFDPTDATGNTLVAGVGLFSSVDDLRAGGARSGVLRTVDGGASWKVLPIPNQPNVRAVAARGFTLLVALAPTWGMYRSTDRGATWTALHNEPGSGLPFSPVFDLAGDPTDPTRFYAASPGNGLFRSTDTGATWTQVGAADNAGFAVASMNNVNTRIEVGPTGRVWIGVAHDNVPGSVTYVGFSDDAGDTWTQISDPRTPEGGLFITQLVALPGSTAALVHFSLVVDPTEPDIAYLGGDGQPAMNSFGAQEIGSARLFRADARRAADGGAPLAPQFDHITHSNMIAALPMGGTAGGTAPPGGSRDMIFDAGGDLIEVNDGGIYRRTQPRGNAGDWSSLNGNLSIAEFHSIAYDSTADIVVGASFDIGTVLQEMTGSTAWQAMGGTPGSDLAVDDTSEVGKGLRYFSNAMLEAFQFERWNADNTLDMANPAELADLMVGGGPAVQPQRITPYALNAVDPNRMVVGAQNGVYESLDRGMNAVALMPGLAVNSKIGDPIAYGGRRLGVANPDVLYVGSSNMVYVRLAAGGMLVESMTYPGRNEHPPRVPVTDIVLDPDDWQRAFVTDGESVYATADAGVSWENITGNLGQLTGDPRALAYVAAPDGVDAVVVGTRTGVYVAHSNAPMVWQRLGTGMPNVPVWDLDYDDADDLLVAGTLGRGAWTIQGLKQAAATLTLTCPAGTQIQECNAPGVPTGGWVGTLGGLGVTGPAGAFPLSLRVSGIAGVAPVDVPGHVMAAGAWQIPFGTAPFPRIPVGMHTVTLTLTGQNGETGTCNVMVSVRDTTAPMIMCPMDVTVPATGAMGAMVNYAAPLVLDNCDMGIVPMCMPAAGTVFPVGNTTVTCTATDAAGNMAMCTFRVTVTGADTQAPVVTCPPNMTVPATGLGGAVVNYPAPTVTDNVDVGLMAACVPASASLFGVGTTTVTCTATDAAGNVGMCTFTVTVTRDTVPPVVTCPPNVTVPGTGLGGAVVNYPAPTVTDNMDMGLVAVCVPPSASLFPFGTTTVTCTATDAAGNVGRCTFTVTVSILVDTQAPVVTCPPNVTVPATGPTGAPVMYPAPTVTDNVDMGLMAVCMPASGTMFPVGATTVTCTATDRAGNVGRCTFTVTVTGADTQAPVVTCPPNMTVPATGLGGAVVNYPAPTVMDNVDVGLMAACVPASASLFGVGTTTVTCTATDAAGNTGMCTFTVTVTRDTQAPVVTCPPNVTVPGTGIGGAVVNYPAPMVTDNVDMGLVAVCVPPSASLFPFGTTTVTCTATDAAGNVGRCTFTVTVSRLVDTQAPVVTCPPNVTVPAAGPTGATVVYPAPTVTDNVDMGLVATCVPASGSLFPVGMTTVTCTATDAAGNVGRCTFTVTVTGMVDTQAPVVTCPPDVTVVATVAGGAMVTYPAPTVTDNVDMGLTAVCVPASGEFFGVGATTVTCRATDAAGNMGMCTFTVTVTAMPDTQAPVVTCPPNVTVPATDPTGAVVNYPAPTVTDNVDVGLMAVCVPASGALFPVGTTNVICTVTDAAGNVGRCTFTVTVTAFVTACQGPLRSATIETDVFVGDTPAIDLSVQLRQGFRFDSPVTDMVAMQYMGAFPGPMAGLQDVLRVQNVTVTNGVARVVLTVTADAMTFPGGSFGDALRRLDVVVNGRRNVGIARFNADELRREAWFSWNPRCGDRPDCANPQPIDPAANCPPRFAPRFQVTASARAL